MHPDPTSFQRWQRAEREARDAENILYQASLDHARGASSDSLERLGADARRKRERAQKLLASSSASVRAIVRSLEAPGRTGAEPRGEA